MKYDEIVAAWDAQKVRFHTWETLPDRERIEFALSLSGKVEKQWPVDDLEDLLEEYWNLAYNEGKNKRVKGAGETLHKIRSLFSAKRSIETKPAAYFVVDEDGDYEYNKTDKFSNGQTGGTPLYTAPQPCPECAEKQSAIDVWEGRYADKAAECEKLKADLAEHAAFREICVENANVQANEAMRYQKRISTLTKERDELAAQVEKMRIALAEILNWNKDLDRPVLDAYVKSILAIHDLSTGILNRVRAETADSGSTEL